jgi:hypothetical protein
MLRTEILVADTNLRDFKRFYVASSISVKMEKCFNFMF